MDTQSEQGRPDVVEGAPPGPSGSGADPHRLGELVLNPLHDDIREIGGRFLECLGHDLMMALDMARIKVSESRIRLIQRPRVGPVGFGVCGYCTAPSYTQDLLILNTGEGIQQAGLYRHCRACSAVSCLS